MSSRRNEDLVENLIPDFRPRYEPLFAWSDAVSAYQMLPVLRGFWPGSASAVTPASAGQVSDLSGNSRTLTAASTIGAARLNAPSGIMIPYMSFNGGSFDYFFAADNHHYDISGTESYVASAARGLTMGAWVYLDTTGTTRSIMGRWLISGNERAYLLQNNSSGDTGFFVSSDGTSANSSSVTQAMSNGAWYFVVGRFDPSTEVKLWIDSTASTSTSSIVSSIHNPSDSFYIGYGNSGASTWDGRICLAFLCACALPDVYVETLWALTKPLFGK